MAVTVRNTIFWDVTPCSSVGIYRHFGGMYCFYIQGRRVSQASNKHVAALAYSSTLKMGAVRSSETSVNLDQTTRRHTPADRTLYYVYFSRVLTTRRHIHASLSLTFAISQAFRHRT
jgi:hypothetical protein